jgi:hypothetical protein
MINTGNKYKCFIQHDGANYMGVNLVKPITISGKKDDQSFRYARKSSVWKFARYENVALYDAIKLLLLTPSTLANEILVKCELWDNWIAMTEVVYTGYVPLSGIAINEDNGIIEITPSEKSDYDWYDQHKNDKHDIYNEVTGTYEMLGYYVSTIIEEYWVPAAGGTYITPNGFNSDTVPTTVWNPLTSYVIGYEHDSWAEYPNGTLWHCISSNVGHQPSVGSSYWERLADTVGIGGYATDVDHIYREVCDLPFKTNAFEYIQGDGVFEAGFPAVMTANVAAIRGENLHEYRWSRNAATTESGYMILCGTTTAADNVVSTGKNHGLMDVLSYLLQVPYKEKVTGDYLAPSGLTISSKFLTDTNNPVTGIINHYSNLRLVHNRSVKGIDDIETTGEMTLEGLLRDLCETLQLSWSIIGTTFYIEHVNFFDIHPRLTFIQTFRTTQFIL